MENHDLKELSRVLELKATREILLSIHEGKNQYSGGHEVSVESIRRVIRLNICKGYTHQSNTRANNSYYTPDPDSS